MLYSAQQRVIEKEKALHRSFLPEVKFQINSSCLICALRHILYHFWRVFCWQEWSETR